MKFLKFGVLIVVLNVSSAALAGWEKLSQDDTGDKYLEIESIKWIGRVAKVWEMIDYREPVQVLGKSYSSIKYQHSIDCIKQKHRVEYNQTYSGQMGTGQTALSNSIPGTWRPYISGSAGMEVFHRVCE